MEQNYVTVTQCICNGRQRTPLKSRAEQTTDERFSFVMLRLNYSSKQYLGTVCLKVASFC